MKQLACFFKSSHGVEEHNLNEQYKMLKDYTAGHRAQLWGSAFRQAEIKTRYN